MDLDLANFGGSGGEGFGGEVGGGDEGEGEEGLRGGVDGVRC